MRHKSIHNAIMDLLSVNSVDDDNVKRLGIPSDMFYEKISFSSFHLNN